MFSRGFLIRLDYERVAAIKLLFGVNDNSPESFVDENMKHIEELTNLLVLETSNKTASDTLPSPHQVYIIVRPFFFSGEESFYF